MKSTSVWWSQEGQSPTYCSCPSGFKILETWIVLKEIWKTRELVNYFPSCSLGRSLAFKRKLSSMVFKTRKHWGSQVPKSMVLRAAFLEIAKTFWPEEMGVSRNSAERKLEQLKMYGPPMYSSHQQPWQHTLMRKDKESYI